MTVRVYTLTDRPELGEQVEPMLVAAWPAFVLADPVASAVWPRVTGLFADYHVVLVEDPAEAPIGVGYSIPFRWDGTPGGLPGGWHAVVVQALEDHDAGRDPTAAAALSITVAPTHQGRGLSGQLLGRLRQAAAAHGLPALVAPVRPSNKHRYPLIPMDRYVRWRRADGAPWDPWLRVHWRFGAELVAVCPESMRITSTVAQWETWTGLALPDSEDYVVPGALVPIKVDRTRDEGSYVEPNVWMHHRLQPVAPPPAGPDLAGRRRLP
jgi:GNAT superfamily N-acetyltransferase